MKFLIFLVILATVQTLKCEIPLEKDTADTNTEVIVKNKITPKKEGIQLTAVKPTTTTRTTTVKPKPTPVVVKVYDDSVLKWNISTLLKRSSQQENYLKQLVADVAFIKKSVIKVVNQNADWTVIQRRQDGSLDFDRTWNEYKEGFGESQGEFFVGLDSLHEMTAEGDPQELLIILEDFENQSRYAKYDKFKVGSEDDKYFIEELGEYSGDAGDSMSYHRGRKFSTKDQDNDNNPTANCAKDYKAGWWFDNCYSSNLNGPYLKGSRTCRGGINWYHWHNYMYSLKFVEMLIRPAAAEEE